MPCWEWFAARPEAEQAEVLGTAPRVAVEAGVAQGWHRWADEVVSIERFGASAPGGAVMEQLGITAAAVADAARAQLS